MDYSFYALVAICIFLLILTFYLAVRRRRHARKRELVRNQNYDPVANDTYRLNSGQSGTDTVITLDIPPRISQGYCQPFTSELNGMTNRPSPPPGFTSTAASKPEDNLPQLPPPSYQDYSKDVRLLHSLHNN